MEICSSSSRKKKIPPPRNKTHLLSSSSPQGWQPLTSSWGVGRSCRDCPVTLSPIEHQSYTVDLRSIFNPRLLSFCRDCVCRSGQILLDQSVNFFRNLFMRGHANFRFFILFRRKHILIGKPSRERSSLGWVLFTAAPGGGLFLYRGFKFVWLFLAHRVRAAFRDCLYEI